MEEANKLVGTGKKHLVTGKVVEAVGALQEACRILAKKYGDTADECGEAFYWCGKALLDLARMENSVLGNALEGVPEEEEEEEGEEKPKDSNVESVENVDEKSRDELRVQVYDAMAEKKTDDSEKQSEATEESKPEGSEATAEQQQEEDSKDESPAEEQEGESEAAAEQEESTDKPEEAGGDEDEDDEETEAEVEELGEGEPTADKDSEDEEVGNLQLAWEMLEVAKVIYRRKEGKDDQLMAAQTHLKLGEVSAESGNYNQALEDFQECLKLQLKHLDPDSRLLAETHYQLGVTHSLNLQYAPAVQALNDSISVIKNRLGNLQEMMDKAESPEALEEERKEMEELKALLPEIQEKVDDANEGMKSSAEADQDGASSSSALPESTISPADSSSSPALQSTNSSSSEHPSTVPVSDISHLVRKKRKPESPVKEAEVKRLKQDDQEPQTNGIHKTNGDSAGNMEVAK
ncbi:nuclear autoantigenic sperm protein-like [Poeciliopsis prolifica]|uniref:nuclear autoantigenic sperm protein-like n=1 Tax=Poeciliopsis prolifica TaxID=188132 RepID=UPI002412FD0A|nr:nuclear autoantigenic sperm protein-like [Poeciliopsis prolifica]